jgi:hypothetical protein
LESNNRNNSFISTSVLEENARRSRASVETNTRYGVGSTVYNGLRGGLNSSYIESRDYARNDFTNHMTTRHLSDYTLPTSSYVHSMTTIESERYKSRFAPEHRYPSVNSYVPLS